MPERILLTQLRRIGDVMMTTPAVAALRAARPQAHISYLTEAPCDQIFRHSPHVDEVLTWPAKGGLGRKLACAADLRRRRFDVVVDFFGNPRSALITRATGAPRRIGWNFRGRRHLYTEAIDGAGRQPYSADHKLALVEPLGARAGDLTPQLFLDAESRGRARAILAGLGVRPEDFLVVLCPVSRRSYKVWPTERYAALADVLIERYSARILLFFGPGEEGFGNAVRGAMQQQALPDLPPTDLLTMAALFEQAHLFFGNDGGPRHFAIAVGTPSLTVFGKEQPQIWTPPRQSRHRTVEHDPGCKRACHYPRCREECINDLTYESVEQALETYLEELLRHGHPVRHGSAGAPAG